MIKGIIDRFEGHYAIIEMSQGTMEIILKRLLPPGVSVGDVIIIHENHQITIDQEETSTKRKEIEDLANELFED